MIYYLNYKKIALNLSIVEFSGAYHLLDALFRHAMQYLQAKRAHIGITAINRFKVALINACNIFFSDRKGKF
jgi:hypothetical protein